MLFPSNRPPRIPVSTSDSPCETNPGQSMSSYTRWSRSPTKAQPTTRRTATSASTQRSHYENEPFSDILHNQYARQQPIYSPFSPRRSTLNNLLPISNGAPNGNIRPRIRHSNWSSLGSLNSFGESITTPPSSQDHTAASSTSQSNTNGQQRETLHSRFDFKQTLGKGTYGKVKLALDKRRNEQVAIKTIKKSRIENPHDLARIRREIDFMTSLNHPYIIKIKEVYESREKIILVMEYASGGELYDYLNRMKRIPESQARAIFRQIVSAVHFLHKNQIVHRDLKLENILIDHNGDIKLADFGLSNSWSSRRLLHTFCGSPLYASPEIVSGIPYYGPEVDCWSLGVLLYTLVFGSMPFQGGDYNRLVRNITSGDFIKPREQSGALSLIQSCLKPDANTRATTKDILRHEWLANGPILAISRLSSTTNDYETVKLRTITPVETPSSTNNSLVELELHSSSFYDTNRLRDHSIDSSEQQRRQHHRASAIPISVRYLSTNPSSSSSSTGTRPSYHRRPVSLALDDQRTAAAAAAAALTDRFSLTLTPPDSTPTARFPLSSDYDLTSEDTPKSSPPSTKIAPSIFTTSAIKFAPVPSIQRLHQSQDQENSSARLETNSDKSTNTASNSTNRHSLLTSLELPSTYINRLLDDNNNLLSLKVYE